MKHPTKKKITQQDLRLARSLFKVRKAHDLTQEIMAERMGVSLEWYGKIERGKTLPHVHFLYAFARILKVKVKDIFPF